MGPATTADYSDFVTTPPNCWRSEFRCSSNNDLAEMQNSSKLSRVTIITHVSILVKSRSQDDPFCSRTHPKFQKP